MTLPISSTCLCVGVLLLLASGCSNNSEDSEEVKGVGGGVGGGKANGGAFGAVGGKISGGTTTGGSTSPSTSLGGSANGGAMGVGGGTSGGSTSSGDQASGGLSITRGGAATSGASGETSSGASGETSSGTAAKASGGSPTGTGSKASGGASTGTGGKASGGAGTGGGAGTSTGIVLPTANASFDYQIGGAYTPPTGVRVVSRDRNSPTAPGLYNICYVNGFQIQPDEESFWTAQHPSLILRDASNNPIVDAGWDEMLLDTSTAAKRAELAAIVGGWIAQCKTDGFDAIEIDNLDSYSRSKGLLTQANNVAFMAQLSNVAHTNGLAIAQKNSSELLGSVSAMGTDFAVVEECNRYDECDTYQSAYGDLVFVIEYRAQDFQKGCSAYPELSIVLRDLNVSIPSSSSYVYQGC